MREGPARDFLRERKLGLLRLLLLLVTWGQDTVDGELAAMCGWDGEAPSPSALTQQWRKLSDSAMPSIQIMTSYGYRRGRLPLYTGFPASRHTVPFALLAYCRAALPA